MKTIFSNDEVFMSFIMKAFITETSDQMWVKPLQYGTISDNNFELNANIRKFSKWIEKLRKREMLVTSNFSFSHCVFKRLVLQTPINQGLFGNELTPSQTTNFTLYQIERFCRRQNEFNENGRKLSKRIENTGKRRNCSL